MSSLYSVWDIVRLTPAPLSIIALFLSTPLAHNFQLADLPPQCDDLILRKVNSSDASVFAKRYGGSSKCWGVIWSIISVLFMVAAIIIGIAVFKQDNKQQKEDSEDFLPTKLRI